MILVAITILSCISSAQARHHPPIRCVESSNPMIPVCGMVQPFSGAVTIRVVMHREKHLANPRTRQPRETASYGVVAHPEGCPRSAFCGCGAAVRVFGHSVRELWLAANWFKFPRAAPASGMVAVRRHHVFVLEQHLGGETWLAYDANSGGHATRIHARSIAGYAIVNPHG